MKSKIFDGLKNMVFEDTDPKPTSTSAAPVAAVPVSVPMTASVPTNLPLDEEAEKVYQKILSETDFSKTEIAATLHRYLDPLASLTALDEHTRFKTAALQAKAQESLSPEKILGTFEGLKVALANEQKEFDSAAEDTARQEIATRQSKSKELAETIAKKQAEIEELTKQLASVTTELTTAQTKIQRAQSSFAAAARRRTAELDQEKAKYADLLKGL